jgi:hypothetical protein
VIKFNPTASLASVMLVSQILAACSSSPQSGGARYPDLNESARLNSESVADEVARTKAELTAARESQERAAARQQTLH